MSCSNCFNGCSEIVSDQCVRYTGIDVPILGIQNGDSLSYVEQALITFLTSTLDGSGIVITLPPNTLCQIVSSNLPTCGPLTVSVLLQALVQSVCQLQTQINTINTSVATLTNQISRIEGSYYLGCITGTTPTAGTHAVLQAVISQLCLFIQDVQTNYVLLSDVNTLIANYLSSQGTSTKYYNRMIPYTVVEYYGIQGSLVGQFDQTGAGIVGTDWEKIYLCNGLNGTPDKRGRVPVGVINGMGGGALDPAVDPAINPTFNPNYSISGVLSKSGTNFITLSTPQLPSHTHPTTVTAAPHTHTFPLRSNGTADGFGFPAVTDNPNVGYGSGITDPATVTLTVANGSTGNNAPHQNNQPALACYYIMYIP
jgi:hypothetical protein